MVNPINVSRNGWDCFAMITMDHDGEDVRQEGFISY